MSPPNQAPAPGSVRRRAARGLGRREGTDPLAGRAATERAIAGAAQHRIDCQLVDDGGRPFARARYEVVGPGGEVVAQGVTAHDGIVRHDVPAGGRYTVRVVEVQSGGAGAAGGGSG